MKRFIMKILRPQWIVNEYGELGLRVLGINLYYYKWDTPLMYGAPEPGWRVAYKREFGEVVVSSLPKGTGIEKVMRP